MTNMLSDWAKEFLREDHVAVVSTLNKDGSSHLTVISQITWFIPRVAQRDALPVEVASQARSILSFFSGKRAEIPLPYGNIRAMKDALMQTH